MPARPGVPDGETQVEAAGANTLTLAVLTGLIGLVVVFPALGHGTGYHREAIAGFQERAASYSFRFRPALPGSTVPMLTARLACAAYPAADSPLRNLGARDGEVYGIKRLGRGDEQAVAPRPAERQVGRDLRDEDLAEPRSIRREAMHAVGGR